MKLKKIVTIVILLTINASFSEARTRKNNSSSPRPQDISAENVKQRYWSQGSESDLGVVQNRLYTKESKIELQPFFGFISADPFLDVHSYGGLLGYHFSEYFAVNALGWKHNVSGSSALERLETDITTGAPTTANLNKPEWFVGSELQFSPLYGKLSLMGKMILYYDFHLMAGAGMTKTQNGQYITPFLGIGQQIYLSQWAALRLDYRHMYYKEEIIERVRPSTFGHVIGKRSTWTSALTMGVSFIF